MRSKYIQAGNKTKEQMFQQLIYDISSNRIFAESKVFNNENCNLVEKDIIKIIDSLEPSTYSTPEYKARYQRNKTIFLMRYGLGKYRPSNYITIANSFDLSNERVAQISRLILNSVCKYIYAHMRIKK